MVNEGYSISSIEILHVVDVSCGREALRLLLRLLDAYFFFGGGIGVEELSLTQFDGGLIKLPLDCLLISRHDVPL